MGGPQDLASRVQRADRFFRKRLAEVLPDGWEEVWAAFADSRSDWQYRRDRAPGFLGTSLDHYVDHGWTHWEELYAFLPSFLLCLEHNDGHRRELLDSAGEYLILMLAAYLHDCGQVCPAEQLVEFANDLVLTQPTPDSLRGLNISEKVRSEVRSQYELCQRHGLGFTAFPGQVRKWHAEIGAWRIIRGREGLFSRPWLQEPVAAVVLLHRKDADKARTTPCQVEIPRLKGSKFTVRTGLLASLIAVADGCMVGRSRVEHARQAIAEVEAQQQRQVLVAADSYGEAACDELVKDLGKQAMHHVLHANIERVACGRGALWVLPHLSQGSLEEWLAGADGWREMTLESGPVCWHTVERTRSDLLAEAVAWIRDELDQVPDETGSSTRQAAISQLGYDPFPEECSINYVRSNEGIDRALEAERELEALLEQELAGAPAEPELFVPPGPDFDALTIAAQEFRRSRGELFRGRARERQELLDFVDGPPAGPRMVVVRGGYGIGKSALLGQLAAELEDRGLPLVSHWAQSGSLSADVTLMLKWLCHQLRPLTTWGAERITPGATLDELSSLFRSFLREASETASRPVTVMIDGFDELDLTGTSRSAGGRPTWLPKPSEVPRNARVVLGVRPASLAELLLCRAELPGAAAEMALGELDSGTAEEIIRAAWPDVPDDSLQALLSWASGQPRFLRHTIALAQRDSDWREAVAGADDGASAVFWRAVELAAGAVGGRQQLVIELLGLMAAVRHELSREEAQKLWPLSDPAWKANLDALIRELDPFVVLRSDRRLSFDHRHYRGLVTERIEQGDGFRQYHKAIADMLEQRGLDNPRTCAEAPYHLEALGDGQRLRSYLERALDWAATAPDDVAQVILRSTYDCDPAAALWPVSRFAVLHGHRNFLSQRVATDLLTKVGPDLANAVVRDTLRLAAEHVDEFPQSWGEFGFRWRELPEVRPDCVQTVVKHIEHLLSCPKSYGVLCQAMRLWSDIGLNGPARGLPLISELRNHAGLLQEDLIEVLSQCRDISRIRPELPCTGDRERQLRTQLAAATCLGRVPWPGFPLALAMKRGERDPHLWQLALLGKRAYSLHRVFEWGLPDVSALLTTLRGTCEDPFVLEALWHVTNTWSAVTSLDTWPRPSPPALEGILSQLPTRVASHLRSVLTEKPSRGIDTLTEVLAWETVLPRQQWMHVGLCFREEHGDLLRSLLDLFLSQQPCVAPLSYFWEHLVQHSGCGSLLAPLVVKSVATPAMPCAIHRAMLRTLADLPPEVALPAKALVARAARRHWEPSIRWDAAGVFARLWPDEAMAMLAPLVVGPDADPEPDFQPFAIEALGIAQMITGQRDEFADLVAELLDSRPPAETVRRVLKTVERMWLVEVRDTLETLRDDSRISRWGPVGDLARVTLECLDLDNRPSLRPWLEQHLREKGYL